MNRLVGILRQAVFESCRNQKIAPISVDILYAAYDNKRKGAGNQTVAIVWEAKGMDGMDGVVVESPMRCAKPTLLP